MYVYLRSDLLHTIETRDLDGKRLALISVLKHTFKSFLVIWEKLGKSGRDAWGSDYTKFRTFVSSSDMTAWTDVKVSKNGCRLNMMAPSKRKQVALKFVLNHNFTNIQTMWEELGHQKVQGEWEDLANFKSFVYSTGTDLPDVVHYKDGYRLKSYSYAHKDFPVSHSDYLRTAYLNLKQVDLREIACVTECLTLVVLALR